MRNAKILVAGVNGLSNEVCKNLVLAGIGALTIIDPDVVREEDLGAQFFLREEDIGKSVGVSRLRPRSDSLTFNVPTESRVCHTSCLRFESTGGRTLHHGRYQL